MIYTDQDLHNLTCPTYPLLEGNRSYDVLVSDGQAAHLYEVQAPNKVQARTIARERALRINRHIFTGTPRVISCERGES